jgi:hypothetical protein
MRPRTRSTWKAALGILAAVVVAGAVGIEIAAAATPGVEPATVTLAGNPGDTFTITKTVHTPAIPPKPDVVFLADTTASMGGSITNVKANATSIMNEVRNAQADSDFGAANYTDFGCSDPFPFHLDEAVTDSIADVQTAINGWTIGDGCDVPEAQINALYQLATDPAVGFRAGSTRIIVWFGDASGHDPSNGHTLTDAINALVAAGIKVIAIPVTAGGDGLDSTGQATAVATATGGLVLPSAAPGDVSDAILAGLMNLPVTVSVSATCDTGLSVVFTPAGAQTVTSGDDVVYTETISIDPSNAGGATLHCTVDFLLDGLSGGPAFRQTISADVNAAPECSGVTAGPNLWPPNHKYRLLTLTGATDPDGDPVALSVDGVTQDEPLNGHADGNTSPDAKPGPTADQVYLRGERSGNGDGRAYRLAFTGDDGQGGTCSGVVVVGVPHDRGKGKNPVDSGLVFVDF